MAIIDSGLEIHGGEDKNECYAYRVTNMGIECREKKVDKWILKIPGEFVKLAWFGDNQVCAIRPDGREYFLGMLYED